MKIISSQINRKRIAAAAAAAAFVPAAGAFVTPSGRAATHIAVQSPISPTSLVASTLENPTVTASLDSSDIVESNTAEEIVNSAPRTTLDVRIHGEWYDLTGM